MSRYDRANHVQPPADKSGRLARAVIYVGLILLLSWLALSVFRLARAGRSLIEQQQRLESLLEAGILNADIQELEQIVVTLREDVVEIKAVAGPFAAAGPLFGWLPGAGPLLADSQHLLEMADAGSELALHAFPALKPLLPIGQDAGDGLTESLPQIVAALDAGVPHLLMADQAAGRLFEARAALKKEGDYPDRLTNLLTRLDENAGLIQDGLKLAQIAPDLLGRDQQRTYLIIAQNEDELRPTGGFISGAGLLTVDQGQIVGLSFDNANLIDDWHNKPYDTPPTPFTEFMGMDIFLFRDANFWPDFAQSAAQAIALYSYGQDIPLDGAIAIDQQFLQRLLAASGPLPVPELERIVDADSVVDQLREEWGPGGESENWIIDRKAFMGPLAAAFLSQIYSGSLSARGFELVKMLQMAAQERHLQLYSADPTVAEILDQTGWSGRLIAGAGGDFLHISDTNMGFNKVNAAVERSLSYHISLDDSGGQMAQLEVHYSNPPVAEDVECQHGTRYNPDTQYQTLTTDCYWNYLRVYVPSGSELLWSSKHPVAEDKLMSGQAWPGVSRTGGGNEDSFTIFDNFILAGTGQDVTVSFQYELPDTVMQSDGEWYNYRLYVRKQAGTAAETASIRVTIPDGANLVDVAPQPASINGNSLLFALELASDATIDVTYGN